MPYSYSSCRLMLLVWLNPPLRSKQQKLSTPPSGGPNLKKKRECWSRIVCSMPYAMLRAKRKRGPRTPSQIKLKQVENRKNALRTYFAEKEAGGGTGPPSMKKNNDRNDIRYLYPGMYSWCIMAFVDVVRSSLFYLNWAYLIVRVIFVRMRRPGTLLNLPGTWYYLSSIQYHPAW